MRVPLASIVIDMDRRSFSIAGLIVAVIGLAALLYFDTPSGNDERDRFIVELQAFPEYAAHETVLRAIIEQTHEEVVEHNLKRRQTSRSHRKILIWDGYRAEMYRKLIVGLTEAGHPDVAVRLEQFRARH